MSRGCNKCGRAVCRRCDPELVEDSQLCHQCVNVYTRRGKVAPMARVNKEMEVRHHQAWVSRWAYALGLVWSGAGHLFTGLPVRGALHAFVFAFAITVAINREGLLRTPGDVRRDGGLAGPGAGAARGDVGLVAASPGPGEKLVLRPGRGEHSEAAETEARRRTRGASSGGVLRGTSSRAATRLRVAARGSAAAAVSTPRSEH